MMKKCPKCGNEHIVLAPSLSNDSLIHVDAYVCMKCGYVELYADNHLMNVAKRLDEKKK